MSAMKLNVQFEVSALARSFRSLSRCCAAWDVGEGGINALESAFAIQVTDFVVHSFSLQANHLYTSS